MTQEYTIKIQNLYENRSREVRVNGQNPMTVHKDIYMKELKLDEEISSICDSDMQIVFELKKGFTSVN